VQILRGNLHVHSSISDGSLPIADIARAAAHCGLDFIGINDHHVACSENQYVQDVLVLRGTEYNSLHSHYLAYNCRASLPAKQVEGAEVVQHVIDNKGMGVIAHPYEKGSPIVSRGKHYPWLDWNVTGFQGIELWNLTSQWRDAAVGYWPSLRMWLWDRHRPFFAGASPQALAKWDEVCQSGHVTGLAGSDLHAPALGIGRLRYRILDYPMLLAAVNNYVLVEGLKGDASSDSDQVVDAMVRGSCWIAFDYLALAQEFNFEAETSREFATMGGTLKVAEGVKLSVGLPRRGRIKLICNGRMLESKIAKKWNLLTTNPGVYRVEVDMERRGEWIPWIYSNPVYLKNE